MGFIITFASATNPTAQISVIRDDSSAPPPHMTVEVSEVAEVYEPWGVRRFFVVDPNGVVLNIMSRGRRIAPS